MSDIWPDGGAEKDDMDSFGFPHLDPERAERLLADRSAIDAAAGTGRDPLARLLAAAAAPGRPAELAGEQAALAAFRDAVLPAAQRPAGRLRRVLALKIAGLVVALTAGGVAVAASAGLVPGPLRDETPLAPPASESPKRSATPTGSAGSATPPSTPAPAASDKVVPSPATSEAEAALLGRCRAYLATPPGSRGQMMQRSELDALARAAGGGDDSIEAYCTAVVAGEKPAKASKTPHPTSQPSGTSMKAVDPTTPEPNASSPAE
jgi:hypothetical protein